MTDFLTVKPIRTFTVGKDLKTKRSDPFDIEAGEARLLESQKLVEIAGAVERPKDNSKPKGDAGTDEVVASAESAENSSKAEEASTEAKTSEGPASDETASREIPAITSESADKPARKGRKAKVDADD